MSFDINISKIKCSGKHGIYDHEKQNDQEFLVDIHINISDFSADDINKTLNYEEIVSKIEKIAYLKHHELLEDLAENIFNMIFKNKLVKKINLKIEKLDILKKTKSVGIEVSKSKV